MKEVAGLEGLKGQQIRKASSALLKHVAKQQAASVDLLADDEIIYLVRQSLCALGYPVSSFFTCPCMVIGHDGLHIYTIQ